MPYNILYHVAHKRSSSNYRLLYEPFRGIGRMALLVSGYVSPYKAPLFSIFQSLLLFAAFRGLPLRDPARVIYGSAILCAIFIYFVIQAAAGHSPLGFPDTALDSFAILPHVLVF
jgi:hypothetical protein